MRVKLVDLGLHRIGGRCQLGLGLVYQSMRLAARIVNFGLDRGKRLLRQAEHFVVQCLNFFLWRSFCQEVVAHRHNLVNHGFRLGFDCIKSRMHFLRNQHQLILRRHQSSLKLVEQSHQFVNRQLNLSHDLAEHIAQHVHSCKGLVQQTVRRFTRRFDGGTGRGNGGLDARQARFHAHEQGARHHQRRRAHLVTGANRNSLVTQSASLVKLSAGSNQGAVGLLHKVGNLDPDVLNQFLCGVDLVGDHTETFGQSGQLRFDVVYFLAQLFDGLFKPIQCMVYARRRLVQGIQDRPHQLSHLVNQLVYVADHAIDNDAHRQNLLGHAVHGYFDLVDRHVQRLRQLVYIAMKTVDQRLHVLQLSF